MTPEERDAVREKRKKKNSERRTIQEVDSKRTKHDEDEDNQGGNVGDQANRRNI